MRQLQAWRLDVAPAGGPSGSGRKSLTAPRHCCYTARVPLDPMTISVNLPPATVEQLEARAAATGKDLETLVTEAVQWFVLLQKTTFAEVLAPIHKAIAASGMSPEQAEAFLAKELADMRAERRAS